GPHFQPLPRVAEVLLADVPQRIAFAYDVDGRHAMAWCAGIGRRGLVAFGAINRRRRIVVVGDHEAAAPVARRRTAAARRRWRRAAALLRPDDARCEQKSSHYKNRLAHDFSLPSYFTSAPAACPAPSWRYRCPGSS